MRHLYFCVLVLFASALAAYSQNPIINHSFSADPTARVFDGKIYLYPSHDIKSPVARLKDWFCMEDYHVYSSEDLVNWIDHGVILSQNNVPWVERESYSMWAPDCVFKGGKYYFYFPAKAQNAKGFSVGVAVADNPSGLFMPDWKPISGIQGIDPCVMIDKDGNVSWQK